MSDHATSDRAGHETPDGEVPTHPHHPRAPGFPSPPEEAERLRALAAYALADTAPEADFDRFAAIAADLLGLPIGLVNLVGAERVTVKGRQGADVETLPRGDAFCAHAILDDQVLSVPDLTLDSRFAANPLVTGEAALRFYAGAPLRSSLGGQRIGTLCVVGRDPRPALDARESRLLEGLATLAMDRMELRRAENSRRDAQARFERMTAATPGAVVCADRDGVVTHWNAAAERLFGWTAAEAIGRDLGFIVPAELRAAHAAGMARVAAAADGQAFSGRTVELPALRRDDTTFPAQVTLSSWTENGAPAFGAAIHDISARHAAESRLRYLAHHDVLTGCANRARLNELMEEAEAADAPAALVLLDLDGFKRVNDTFGHGTGDALLREVGGRLSAALGERGTLARLGGDEFAAWLPGCGDAAPAERAARDLLGALAAPIGVAGRVLPVGCSAGVALAGLGRAGMLLADADVALYRAKAVGRGTHRLFDESMRDEHAAAQALEEEVHLAALSGQFELHYQPQVDLQRGGLVGAEALLRWRHPERGLLPPSAFLAALEKGPLAGAVGDWAIDEGCRQAAEWRRQGRSLRVGVNLFAEQLRQGRLERTVRDALERWELDPAALELELTENIALGMDGGLLEPLRALHALGVGLAFDDFGTGFASLSTLKSCPLTRLKIDRGFVSGLGTEGRLGEARDRDDVAIIEAVLALARGMGLGVVAEGVETEAQSFFLSGRGCDEGQGYLYGRPAPAVPAPGALANGALANGAFGNGGPGSAERAAGSARLAARAAAWAGGRWSSLLAPRERRRNRR